MSDPAMDHIEALKAEIADLKAQLLAYEPAPTPIIEYPSWRRKRDADGHVTEQVLVHDAESAEALGAGWGS